MSPPNGELFFLALSLPIQKIGPTTLEMVSPNRFQNGPRPIQLVVVNAVRKAVSAATIIFTTISISLFFFIIVNCPLDLWSLCTFRSKNYQLSIILNPPRLAHHRCWLKE